MATHAANHLPALPLRISNATLKASSGDKCVDLFVFFSTRLPWARNPAFWSSASVTCKSGTTRLLGIPESFKHMARFVIDVAFIPFQTRSIRPSLASTNFEICPTKDNTSLWRGCRYAASLRPPRLSTKDLMIKLNIQMRLSVILSWIQIHCESPVNVSV